MYLHILWIWLYTIILQYNIFLHVKDVFHSFTPLLYLLSPINKSLLLKIDLLFNWNRHIIPTFSHLLLITLPEALPCLLHSKLIASFSLIIIIEYMYVRTNIYRYNLQRLFLFVCPVCPFWFPGRAWTGLV